MKDFLAAISVGISPEGAALLDVCYEEDSTGVVDMNVVRTGEGNYVEIQGTGEGRPFTPQELTKLLELAAKGTDELISYERCAGRRVGLACRSRINYIEVKDGRYGKKNCNSHWQSGQGTGNDKCL